MQWCVMFNSTVFMQMHSMEKQECFGAKDMELVFQTNRKTRIGESNRVRERFYLIKIILNKMHGNKLLTITSRAHETFCALFKNLHHKSFSLFVRSLFAAFSAYTRIKGIGAKLQFHFNLFVCSHLHFCNIYIFIRCERWTINSEHTNWNQTFKLYKFYKSRSQPKDTN